MLCFYALPSPAQDILTQAAPAAYEQAWLTVYPQVKVNGSIRDGIEPFMSRNGVLYARPESLRAYGIALPDAEAAEAGKNGVLCLKFRTARPHPARAYGSNSPPSPACRRNTMQPRKPLISPPPSNGSPT